MISLVAGERWNKTFAWS